MALKRYLTPLSKQEKPIRNCKSGTTYKVTGKWGENIYDDINEVIYFLENNHVENFTVIQGTDNDITDVIHSILHWSK